MKSLSLKPEWALKILVGEKTVECRTWKTNYRGEILICSSATKTRGTIPGKALIVATISDIVPFTKKHLVDSAMSAMPDKKSYAWMLTNFKPVYPFDVKGKLNLFDIDDNLIKFIPDDADDKTIDEIYNPLFI